ncbi:hypothetical protein AGMMS49992_18880 [Clostridia bacterium]|nr:hypothetical protein AGMMS49992_18880 [Clostridia bacterium]
MKILYVSPYIGTIRSIFEGKAINTAPAVYYPIKYIIQRGHTLNFACLASKEDKPILDDHMKVFVTYRSKMCHKRFIIQSKVFAYIQFVYLIYKELKGGGYDFVYCKAIETLGPQIAANILRIPVGVRWLGDAIITPEIEKLGYLKAFYRNPIMYFTLKTRCSFLLMTNDLPEGKRLFMKWLPRNNPYPVYYWKSGVEHKSINDLTVHEKLPDKSYIFYAARYARHKRQDRIIEVLKILHFRGYMVSLVMCGVMQELDYLQELRNEIDSLGLDDYVIMRDVLRSDDVRFFSYNAIANLFFYDNSNRGNVLYETLSIGGIAVVLANTSCNDLIENGHNGYLVNDENEAANVIMGLIDHPKQAEDIKLNAYRRSRKQILGTDERFSREVELIECYCENNRHKIDSFPLFM